VDETRKLEIIERLNKKIAVLEKRRAYIKTGFYQESELIDINSAIREIKRKIKLLEKTDVETSLVYE